MPQMSKQDKAALASVEKLIAEVIELRKQATDAEIVKKTEELNALKEKIGEVFEFFERCTEELDKLHDKLYV